MIDLQPLVNKTVEFAYRGARLGFDLSHALFSSFDIDTGTRFLLKEIAHEPVLERARAILDAGCGVGVIGVSLAASCPNAKVVMRDRDILACAFSERNCWRNGIASVRLDLEGRPAERIAKRAPKHKYGGERPNEVIIAPGLLGEDDPLGPFDLIVSNVPAKAGPAILSRFVSGRAGASLNPGGVFAFVIVNTLADQAETWCAASGLTLARKVAGKGHTVFVLGKPETAPAAQATSAADAMPAARQNVAREDAARENAARSALEQPAAAEPAPSLSFAPQPFAGRLGALVPYRRTKGQRALGRYSVPARGFWGLPEFDTASFATELAIDALAKACSGSLVRDFLVSGDRIGLPALWASAALGPDRVHALSRDFQSLLAAASNLGETSGHRPEFIPRSSLDAPEIGDALFDAILWFPDEIPEYDYVAPAWDFMVRTAKKGASIVVVADSNAIARFDKTKPSAIQRLGDRKKKGFSALMLRRV